MHSWNNLLICTLLLIAPISALNILGIFSHPEKSRSDVYNSLLVELTKRGHNLTVVTNFLINNKPENYREILIKPYLDIEGIYKSVFSVGFEDLPRLGSRDLITAFHKASLIATDNALKSENVQSFLKELESESFDLMIVDEMSQEAFLVLKTKLNCPVISVTTKGVEQYMLIDMGMPYVQYQMDHHLQIPTRKKTLFSRISNLYNSYYTNRAREAYLSEQDKLAKKYIKDLFFTVNDIIPRLEDHLKNISFILSNSHPFISSHLIPGHKRIINVGGLHIGRPNELSKDVQLFLSNAQYGAIFITVPSTIFGAEIPLKFIENILEGFTGLRQKVVVQWSGQKLENIPKNVFIKHFIPQSDILAHPYVQIMVSLGDLFSIQSAIYRSVPILSIAITKEQVINSEIIKNGGFGIVLDLSNLTTISIQWAINELMFNGDYSNAIRNTSSLFRNRGPVGSMEEAIYWIEFAHKIKKDPRIIQRTHDSWVINYNVDLILIIIAFVIVLTLIPISILRILYQKRMSKKPNDKKGI